MLEASNEAESGGNSRFAGGVMRFEYSSVDDLKEATDITDEQIANSDFAAKALPKAQIEQLRDAMLGLDKLGDATRIAKLLALA